MAQETEEVESPDIHFTPIISLPPVQLATLEEDEDVMFKMRAKLYRYDSNEDPPEWKERGVGDVKLLKHKEHGTCRLLMRRDKTLKVCANHAVLPLMELKPNCGSDKAWVWSTPADFADEEAKAELLAIRFKTAEDAQKFKETFDEAKKIMEVKIAEKEAAGKDQQVNGDKDETEADKVADKLESLSVKDSEKAAESKSEETSKNDEKKEDA